MKTSKPAHSIVLEHDALLFNKKELKQIDQSKQNTGKLKPNSWQGFNMHIRGFPPKRSCKSSNLEAAAQKLSSCLLHGRNSGVLSLAALRRRRRVAPVRNNENEDHRGNKPSKKATYPDEETTLCDVHVVGT
jgi:hypothetical protein